MMMTMMLSTSLVNSHTLERQSHIFQTVLNKQLHINMVSRKTTGTVRKTTGTVKSTSHQCNWTVVY